MFTTRYITDSFAAISKTLDPKKYSEMEKMQKTIEDNLLSSYTPCPGDAGKSLAIHLNDLNSTRIQDLARSQFYNLSLMDYLTCLTDVAFNTSKYEAGYLNDATIIRNLIKKVKQIGAESVNGYAFKASFKEAKDLYILKATRNVLNDELTHELAVGLLGTNLLRQYCPNFAFIYGGFKCSPPLIEENKEVKAFCTTKDRNGIQYVAYENVNPDGKTVDAAKYVRTCTAKQFMQMYMQVLYALKKANEICDFTHYDLHSENVLVRSLPEGTKKAYISYFTEKREMEKLEVENIATIIDFGYSHIKKGDKNMGTYGIQQFSVLPDVCFPMYDAYKFLMFCARDMLEAKNKEALRAAEVIFSFFNTKESLKDAVEKQRDYYYCMPYTSETAYIAIDDLTTFIRSNINCTFIVPNNIPGKSLVCNDDCLAFQDIIDTTIVINKPMTLWALYDRCSRENKCSAESDVDSLLPSFEKEAEDYINRGEKAAKVEIYNFAEASDDTEFDQYIEEFNKMVEAALYLKDIVYHLKAMMLVYKAFDLSIPNKISSKVVWLDTQYKKLEENVKESVKFLQTSKYKKKFSYGLGLAKYA